MQQELKRVEAYSLMEFSQKVQEAILEGYRFDFDSIQNCPQSFGSYLSAGMLKGVPKVQAKEVAEEVTEEVTREVTEKVVQEQPKGRKGKQ